MIDRLRYYLKTEMRQRGWNQAMLDEFGLEPDKYETNPRYRRAIPTQLYLKSKVHAIEATLEFQQRLAKKRTRGKTMSEAHKRAEALRKERRQQEVLTKEYRPGSFQHHCQARLREKLGYVPPETT